MSLVALRKGGFFPAYDFGELSSPSLDRILEQTKNKIKFSRYVLVLFMSKLVATLFLLAPFYC